MPDTPKPLGHKMHDSQGLDPLTVCDDWEADV